jgi:adenylylsulfate kinase
MDSKKRSLLKTISWYIFHNCMMFTITFLLTHSWEIGVAIALLQTLGESILYYIHERVWLRVKPKAKAE